jgi:hypothetical protein
LYKPLGDIPIQIILGFKKKERINKLIKEKRKEEHATLNNILIKNTYWGPPKKRSKSRNSIRILCPVRPRN